MRPFSRPKRKRLVVAIKTDPGQNNNVADLHPEVIKQLSGEYDKWWTSISERFDEYCEIAIGAPEQNPTMLTCHDWHAAQVPWNHGHIRNNLKSNGFWAVEVMHDGEYQFVLRARPPGVAHHLKTGKALLKIGDKELSQRILEGASEIVFNTTLKAGKTKLTATFEEENSSRGAYFVTVERTVKRK